MKWEGSRRSTSAVPGTSKTYLKRQTRIIHTPIDKYLSSEWKLRRICRREREEDWRLSLIPRYSTKIPQRVCWYLGRTDGRERWKKERGMDWEGCAGLDRPWTEGSLIVTDEAWPASQTRGEARLCEKGEGGHSGSTVRQRCNPVTSLGTTTMHGNTASR